MVFHRTEYFVFHIFPSLGADNLRPAILQVLQNIIMCFLATPVSHSEQHTEQRMLLKYLRDKNKKNTLRQKLVHPKDKTPQNRQNNVMCSSMQGGIHRLVH